MNNQQQELFTEFFQVFSKSTTKTLRKTLDADVCKKISFNFNAFSEVKNAEDLKQDDAIYKIEYVLADKQGGINVLIPEAVVASISDILTGGDGKGEFKGSLSELETNSVLPILTNIFKDIEATFRHAYNQDLVFSANSSILLKESDDYKINSGNLFFDLLAECTMTLNEDDKFQIKILLGKDVIEKVLTHLGFSSSSAGGRKVERTNIDLSCLSDIKINVTAELGRTQVPIKYALELVGGSIIELDTQNNADIKVFANGVEFAYAQVVAIEDNFGLKITKIISPQERLGIVK